MVILSYNGQRQEKKDRREAADSHKKAPEFNGSPYVLKEASCRNGSNKGKQSLPTHKNMQ